MPDVGLLHIPTGQLRWGYTCEAHTDLARYADWLTRVISAGLEWKCLEDLVGINSSPGDTLNIVQFEGTALSLATYSQTHGAHAPNPSTSTAPLGRIDSQFYSYPSNQPLPHLVTLIASENIWVLAWPEHGTNKFRLGWRVRDSHPSVEPLPVASILYSEQDFVEGMHRLCQLVCTSRHVQVIPRNFLETPSTETAVGMQFGEEPGAVVQFSEELSYGGVQLTAPRRWHPPAEPRSYDPTE